MKNTILILAIALLSCKKESVEPIQSVKEEDKVQASIIASDSIQVNLDTFFFSTLDDSISYKADSIDANNHIYNKDNFTIRIANINTTNIQEGIYTNEYLVSNADYGFDLIHSVYVGDSSIVQITIGSTSTQINNLEITEVRNDSLWMEFDVDWTYTHWLYTNKNKSGTIKGELNGFKYR